MAAPGRACGFCGPRRWAPRRHCLARCQPCARHPVRTRPDRSPRWRRDRRAPAGKCGGFGLGGTFGDGSALRAQRCSRGVGAGRALRRRLLGQVGGRRRWRRPVSFRRRIRCALVPVGGLVRSRCRDDVRRFRRGFHPRFCAVSGVGRRTLWRGDGRPGSMMAVAGPDDGASSAAATGDCGAGSPVDA